MKSYELETEKEVSVEALAAIGVLYWNINADTWEKDGKLDEIRKERNYASHDVIQVSREAFGDNFDNKVKTFFEEHLHEDEEIRFILDGSGFFDVRSKDDKWVRCAVEKNDMIILPAGIYHRFTTDDKEYIKAMRLFKENPVWVPVNRGEESEKTPSRQEFLATLSASA